MDRPARVLVVDDEPNIRALLSADAAPGLVRGQDRRVRRRGAAGRREFEPDLVVLDVMLPDLDGFEVAPGGCGPAGRVPVLFLTARDAVEDRVQRAHRWAATTT